MLRSLSINNIALIKSQFIELCDGFNVLSGETGAGKSIIVDCLMLIMGAKFDKTLLRYGEDVCRVEAEFDTNPSVADLLTEYGIDTDDTTVISRKLNADGHSENRINGRSVTLSMIRKTGQCLIDICGQNEYQYLSMVSNHIKVLDSYIKAEIAQIKFDYAEKMHKLNDINKQIAELNIGTDREESLEFFKKKLSEIRKINIKENELEELETLRKKYQSSGKMLNVLNDVSDRLTQGDKSALSNIENASRLLSSITSYGNNFTQLHKRLESVAIELDDISDCVENELSELNFTEDDIDEIEDRLYKVRELIRKYGSYDGVCSKAKYFENKIDFLENADDLFEQYSKQRQSIVDEMYSLACRLSEIRKNAAVKFEKAVLTELSDLGMPDSEFKIMFKDLPAKSNCLSKFVENGLDEAEFYLSPNKGQPLKPLVKIISGGEQSRLMLALKVIAGKADNIQTLVFDEVDVGVSGKIGLEVAKKLAVLSREHQVLCVTHLPQIAAMADNNYFISKETQNKTTITNVKILSCDEQIEEISRLSGTKDISSQSFAGAKDMKVWSNSYKNSL